MEHIDARCDATIEFERQLSDLHLRSFAGGAKISGSWTIETPISTAPDWQVRIDWIASDGNPAAEAPIFDEPARSHESTTTDE